MKFMKITKDGGPKSHVAGLFLIEIKKLFSIVFLRFSDGSREAYHTHAFNAVSWVLRGKLVEHNLDGSIKEYSPSLMPILTPRDTFHKVVSKGDTYVFTLRGAWVKFWCEYIPEENSFITLTHGRNIV